MPFLAAFVTKVIGWFIARVLAGIAFQTALKIAIAAATVAAALAFWSAIMSLKVGLVATIENPYLITGLTAVMPNNFELMLVALMTARFLDWLYRFNDNLFRDVVSNVRTGLPKGGW